MFIHGLQGDPQATWTAESSEVFWPRQLLPRALAEAKVETRILVYGFDGTLATFAGREKLGVVVRNFLRDLATERHGQNATSRPVLFVAYNLGGLLLKQALVHSSEVNSEDDGSLIVESPKVLFS